MVNVNRFIANSDFGSFKNDTLGNSVSVSVANGFRTSTGSPTLGTATLTVGEGQSLLRARMLCSLDDKWGSGTSLITLLNISLMDGAIVLSTQDVVCYATINKLNSTQVELKVYTEGFASAFDIRVNESFTTTFVLATYLSPV